MAEGARFGQVRHEVAMFTHDRLACAFRLGEERPTHPVPAGDAYIHHPWAGWLFAAAMVAICHAAQAHGIVGNRVFPGTLAFDDPAVMDELILPAVSSFKNPAEGTDVG
jgi:hypothetical protein